MLGAKNYSISELIKDPFQLFFMMIGVFTVSMLLPFSLACYNYNKFYSKTAPIDYQYPKFSDFEFSLKFAVVYIPLQIYSCKIMTPLFFGICREQKNHKERELRSQKAAINLYKSLYNQLIVIWGFFIIKNQPYYPKTLGGSGSPLASFDGMPY